MSLTNCAYCYVPTGVLRIWLPNFRMAIRSGCTNLSGFLLSALWTDSHALSCRIRRFLICVFHQSVSDKCADAIGQTIWPWTPIY